MQSEKISVIIPMYNAETQIQKCVNSLLCQTYTNFEIIIVNDGSKDNSLAVCQNTFGNEPRVKIVDKPNGGVSDARNAGMRAAEGEYISFVDADDWVEPTYLSCLYEHLTETGADLSALDYRMESTSPERTVKVEITEEEVVTGSDILERFFTRKIITGGIGKLFRSEQIGDLQFPPNIKIGEDALFVYSFLRRAKAVSIIPQKLYNYWMDNTDGATNNFFTRFDYEAVHFATLILNDVKESNPELLGPASNYLLLPIMRSYLGYIAGKKESLPRFKELTEALHIIFRYADRNSNDFNYYKYKTFYILHKICKPLARVLVSRWVAQQTI